MRTIWLLPLLVILSFILPISRTAEHPAPDPVLTHLVLGGDVMLSRHVARVAREKRDPAFPLRDLAPVLQAADIAFVNLESPFSDRGAVVARHDFQSRTGDDRGLGTGWCGRRLDRE